MASNSSLARNCPLFLRGDKKIYGGAPLFSSYRKPGDKGGEEGEGGSHVYDEVEAGDVGMLHHGGEDGARFGADRGRNLRACHLDPLAGEHLADLGRYLRAVELPVEAYVKRMENDYPEDGDGYEAGHSRNRVVDARRRSRPLHADGVHRGRRERRYAEREAEPEEGNAREERREVAAVAVEEGERNVADAARNSARDERELRAVFVGEPARPAREDEHYYDYREHRRTGHRRRVAIDLYKRER